MIQASDEKVRNKIREVTRRRKFVEIGEKFEETRENSACCVGERVMVIVCCVDMRVHVCVWER